MPIRHLQLYDLKLISVQKLLQIFFEIFLDLCFHHLPKGHGIRASDEEDEHVFGGVREHKSCGVPVVFGGRKQVDPTFLVLPKRGLEVYKNFLDNSVADVGNGILVGLRQPRAKLDMISLEQPQRNGADNPPGSVL